MIRGTRHLLGDEAAKFREVTDDLRRFMLLTGYQEFIPSALAEQGIFVLKAGGEIVNQMYAFEDKKGRPICLIPEVTAIAQRLYKEDWSKRLPKPVKIFYLARCYRYERPQEGRYREFWQFGVEEMGGKSTKGDMVSMLDRILKYVGMKGYYKLNESVKRGLDYYVEDGFEAEVESLGAQKQIAGGGRYDCGIGWAIGVDRLLLALERQNIGR